MIGTYSIVHDVMNGTYSIVHDVMKYTQKHRVCYVTCVSGCFGDVKAGSASLLTPSFIILSPFYRLNEEKGR